MFKEKLLLLSYPLGALAALVLILILQDGSYLAKLIDCFPQEIRNKCQNYISYLDRVSLILFIGLAVSFFLGESFYVHISEILFYFAFGLYLSSSAVILLFLSRK